MSTNTERDQSQPSPTIECAFRECSNTGRKWEFHHGKFCSNACEYRSRGRKFLQDLKYDHCRCFTCLTRLKEIEPAKPKRAFDVTGAALTYDIEEERVTMQRYDQYWSEKSAIGFQHRTPESGFGEKQVHEDMIGTGTVCDVCGSTNHTQHTWFVVEPDPLAGEIVNYLEDADEVDGSEVDFEVDRQTLHRSYGYTGDIERAVGEATRNLEGGNT